MRAYVYNHDKTNRLSEVAMRSLLVTSLALTLTTPLAAQEKFGVDVKDAPVPKEVDARIGKLLAPKAIQFNDGGGKTIAEFWLRAQIPTDATAEQIKNGITYRELKQSELLGVIRFEKDWHDYRKQKVLAGVYTMRLAVQPMDGDHMGMGDFQDYALLLDAGKDTSPAPLDKDTLYKISMKTINTGHPAVLMLVPTPAKGKEAEIVNRVRKEWVVNVRRPLTAGGKDTGAVFGIGLTLEGHAE